MWLGDKPPSFHPSPGCYGRGQALTPSCFTQGHHGQETGCLREHPAEELGLVSWAGDSQRRRQPRAAGEEEEEEGP